MRWVPPAAWLLGLLLAASLVWSAEADCTCDLRAWNDTSNMAGLWKIQPTLHNDRPHYVRKYGPSIDSVTTYVLYFNTDHHVWLVSSQLDSSVAYRAAYAAPFCPTDIASGTWRIPGQNDGWDPYTLWFEASCQPACTAGCDAEIVGFPDFSEYGFGSPDGKFRIDTENPVNGKPSWTRPWPPGSSTTLYLFYHPNHRWMVKTSKAVASGDVYGFSRWDSDCPHNIPADTWEFQPPSGSSLMLANVSVLGLDCGTNCTLAPMCGLLHRASCRDGEVDHTCGECLMGWLPGPEDSPGPSNEPCVPYPCQEADGSYCNLRFSGFTGYHAPLMNGITFSLDAESPSINGRPHWRSESGLHTYWDDVNVGWVIDDDLDPLHDVLAFAGVDLPCPQAFDAGFWSERLANHEMAAAPDASSATDCASTVDCSGLAEPCSELHRSECSFQSTPNSCGHCIDGWAEPAGSSGGFGEPCVAVQCSGCPFRFAGSGQIQPSELLEDPETWFSRAEAYPTWQGREHYSTAPGLLVEGTSFARLHMVWHEALGLWLVLDAALFPVPGRLESWIAPLGFPERNLDSPGAAAILAWSPARAQTCPQKVRLSWRHRPVADGGWQPLSEPVQMAVNCAGWQRDCTDLPGSLTCPALGREACSLLPNESPPNTCGACLDPLVGPAGPSTTQRCGPAGCGECPLMIFGWSNTTRLWQRHELWGHTQTESAGFFRSLAVDSDRPVVNGHTSYSSLVQPELHLWFDAASGSSGRWLLTDRPATASGAMASGTVLYLRTTGASAVSGACPGSNDLTWEEAVERWEVPTGPNPPPPVLFLEWFKNPQVQPIQASPCTAEVDCSARRACQSDLNRYPCSVGAVANTCGGCLDGFAGGLGGVAAANSNVCQLVDCGLECDLVAQGWTGSATQVLNGRRFFVDGMHHGRRRYRDPSNSWAIFWYPVQSESGGSSGNVNGTEGWKSGGVWIVDNPAMDPEDGLLAWARPGAARPSHLRELLDSDAKWGACPQQLSGWLWFEAADVTDTLHHSVGPSASAGFRESCADSLDCSEAPDCLALRRQPCQGLHLTPAGGLVEHPVPSHCGACLPAFSGSAGPSNTECAAQPTCARCNIQFTGMQVHTRANQVYAVDWVDPVFNSRVAYRGLTNPDIHILWLAETELWVIADLSGSAQILARSRQQLDAYCPQSFSTNSWYEYDTDGIRMRVSARALSRCDAANHIWCTEASPSFCFNLGRESCGAALFAPQDASLAPALSQTCGHCLAGSVGTPGPSNADDCRVPEAPTPAPTPPGAPCVFGQTWSPSGRGPCTACTPAAGACQAFPGDAVAEACSLTADIVCLSDLPCVEGTSWSSTGQGPCQPCRSCGAGVTPEAACTPTSDTVCPACAEGTSWSLEADGRAPCHSCADCGSSGGTVLAPCSPTNNTVCSDAVACPAGQTFSSTGWSPCLDCRVCGDATLNTNMPEVIADPFAWNSLVAQECTPGSDRVCRGCVRGSTWSEAGMAPCTACSTCGAGDPVWLPCTPERDTVCASQAFACPEGLFSVEGTGFFPCLDCGTCPLGQLLRTPCNATHDTECYDPRARPEPIRDPDSDDSSAALAVGLSLGGLLLCVGLLLAAWCLISKRRQKLRWSKSQGGDDDINDSFVLELGDVEAARNAGAGAAAGGTAPSSRKAAAATKVELADDSDSSSDDDADDGRSTAPHKSQQSHSGGAKAAAGAAAASTAAASKRKPAKKAASSSDGEDSLEDTDSSDSDVDPDYGKKGKDGTTGRKSSGHSQVSASASGRKALAGMSRENLAAAESIKRKPSRHQPSSQGSPAGSRLDRKVSVYEAAPSASKDKSKAKAAKSSSKASSSRAKQAQQAPAYSDSSDDSSD